MTYLTRSSRNSGLRNLQREIDRVFDNFFPTPSDESSESQSMWAPRTDLTETEDAFHIHVDLPGLSKDDLKINCQDNQLTISGERRSERTTEGEEFVRVERAFGNFYRSFTLPHTANAEGIEATYENGVLSVSVPKREESKPRQIEVR